MNVNAWKHEQKRLNEMYGTKGKGRVVDVMDFSYSSYTDTLRELNKHFPMKIRWNWKLEFAAAKEKIIMKYESEWKKKKTIASQMLMFVVHFNESNIFNFCMNISHLWHTYKFDKVKQLWRTLTWTWNSWTIKRHVD